MLDVVEIEERRWKCIARAGQSEHRGKPMRHDKCRFAGQLGREQHQRLARHARSNEWATPVPEHPRCLLKDPPRIRRGSDHTRDDRRVDRPCLSNLTLDSLARLGNRRFHVFGRQGATDAERCPGGPNRGGQQRGAGGSFRWFAR